ncbi:MAG TPA: hypothetical protein V6D47_06540 [Oscillatoriaceae cyanobacterium]
MRSRWLGLLAVCLTACNAKTPVAPSLAIGDTTSSGSMAFLPLAPPASSAPPGPSAAPIETPTPRPTPTEAPAEVGVLVAQGFAQAVRIVDVRTGRMLAAQPQPLWLGPSMPHVSRDGREVVYATQTSHGEQLVLWDLVHDAEVSIPQLTNADAREPDLDADGNALVYITDDAFQKQVTLFDRRLGEAHTLPIPKAFCVGAREPTLSGDGRVAAYVMDSARGDADIVVVDVATGRPVTVPQLNTVYDETEPALSEDGKTLLFVSNRNGSQDVFAVDTATGNALDTSAFNSFADETWPRFVGPQDDTIAYVSAASGPPALVAQQFQRR